MHDDDEEWTPQLSEKNSSFAFYFDFISALVPVGILAVALRRLGIVLGFATTASFFREG